MKLYLAYLLMKSVIPLVAVLLSLNLNAQQGFLLVKKKNRTIRFFGTDSRLTFQLSDGQWITGTIDKIQKDTFQFTQEIIRYYTIGTDTFRYRGQRYALNDIYAITSAKQQYYFQNDQVVITLGRERFAWIRNGFLFQIAGAGYAGLNIINDLYRKEPSFTGKKVVGLGVSAIAFIFGSFLHSRFDPFIRPGRKYKFELVNF